jgi:hypothetical protein
VGLPVTYNEAFCCLQKTFVDLVFLLTAHLEEESSYLFCNFLPLFATDLAFCFSVTFIPHQCNSDHIAMSCKFVDIFLVGSNFIEGDRISNIIDDYEDVAASIVTIANRFKFLGPRGVPNQKFILCFSHLGVLELEIYSDRGKVFLVERVGIEALPELCFSCFLCSYYNKVYHMTEFLALFNKLNLRGAGLRKLGAFNRSGLEKLFRLFFEGGVGLNIENSLVYCLFIDIKSRHFYTRPNSFSPFIDFFIIDTSVGLICLIPDQKDSCRIFNCFIFHHTLQTFQHSLKRIS